MKTGYERDICIPMFITALLIVAKTGKQLVSINRWKAKENVIYIDITGYYSDIRKKEFFVFLTTWMGPEDIILSEINQTEREILHDIIYKWNLKKISQTHRKVEK